MVKRKINYLAYLCTAIVVFLLSSLVTYTYSYFTARANKSGEIKFATVDVSMTMNNSTFSGQFQEVEAFYPGQTITLPYDDSNTITVKNNGTTDSYVLMNLNVEIVPEAGETLTYNYWYDLSGNQVNTTNFELNEVGADLLAPESTADLPILTYTFPGEPLTNEYKGATARFNLTPYAIQSLLPKDAEAYVSDELYASYFICKNASEIYADTLGVKNLFDKSQALITGIKYETVVSSWGAAVLNNEQVKQMLKPDTNYTISYDIECTNSYYNLGYNENWKNAGFILYDTYSSPVRSVSFVKSKYYLKDETDHVVVKFKTPSDLEGFRLLVYTNRFTDSSSNQLLSSMIFSNVMLVEGEYTADDMPEYKPYSLVDNQITSEPLYQIGKNLIDYSTVSNNVGSPIENVICDSEYIDVQNKGLYTYNCLSIPMLKANTTYTLWYQAEIYNRDSGTGNTITYIRFADEKDEEGRYLYAQQTRLTANGDTATGVINYMPNENKSNVLIYFNTNYGSVIYANAKWKIMVVEGLYTADTMPAYEPYLGDHYDETTGVVTRNVGKLELTGNEDWSVETQATTDGKAFLLTVSDMKTDPKLACNKFKVVSNEDNYKNMSLNTIKGQGTTNIIYICADFADVTSFKTWLTEQHNAGIPVTIWYQLETAKESKVYTSKNLYNATQSANFTISDSGTQNLTGETPELGSSLFNYLLNKDFVISFKIKRYNDDDTTNICVSVETSDENIKYTKDIDCIADDQWRYYWIQIPKTSNISSFTVNLFNGTYGSNSHFEIKNIQIEIGTSPTDYKVNTRINLLDVNSLNVKDNDRSEVTITDGKVEINNPTAAYKSASININVKPLTTYTLSAIMESTFNGTSYSGHIAVSLYKKDGTLQKSNIIIYEYEESGKGESFTTYEETAYISVSLRNRYANYGCSFANIMLQQNDFATEYVPYV